MKMKLIKTNAVLIVTVLGTLMPVSAQGQFFKKLKNQIAKYGVNDIHILTARSQAAASAIQQWLKSHGINLPLENITGLGNSTGEAKADWIENLIFEGYNDIYFVRMPPKHLSDAHY